MERLSACFFLIVCFFPVEPLEVAVKRHFWSLAGLYPLSMPYIFTSGSNILKIDLDVHGDCFKYRIGVGIWAGFRPGRICDLSFGIQL